MSSRNAAPPGPFEFVVVYAPHVHLTNTGMLVPYAPDTHESTWTPHLVSSGVARTQLSRRNPDMALFTLGDTNSAFEFRLPCWSAVMTFVSNVDLSSVPTFCDVLVEMNSYAPPHKPRLFELSNDRAPQKRV